MPSNDLAIIGDLWPFVKSGFWTVVNPLILTAKSWNMFGNACRITWCPDPVCTTHALGRAEELIELTVTDNDHDTASSTVKIVNALVHELKEAIDNLP